LARCRSCEGNAESLLLASMGDARPLFLPKALKVGASGNPAGPNIAKLST
jgi:hypothetical protein